jgi:hypothetical protein
MAGIARVGTGGTEQNFNSVTTSQTYTLPAYTPGNWLCLPMVVHGTGTTNSVPTVTGSSGGAWNVRNNVIGASGKWFNATIAYRENAPAGMTSVTIGNLDATGNFITAKSEEFSGVATSNSLDTAATGGGQVNSSNAGPTGTLASGNMTTGNSGSLVIGICCSDDSANSSWASTLNGFTSMLAEGNSNSFQVAQSVFQVAAGSTGPFSLTWVYSAGSDQIVGILCSFLPQSVASPGVPMYYPRRQFFLV